MDSENTLVAQCLEVIEDDESVAIEPVVGECITRGQKSGLRVRDHVGEIGEAGV